MDPSRMIPVEDRIASINWAVLHQQVEKMLELDHKKARALVKEYQRFFFLKAKYKDYGNRFLAPSMPVAEIWHQHLLRPQDYIEDCRFVTGENLINHYPMETIKDPEGYWRRYGNTLRYYEDSFGHPPPHAQWPRRAAGHSNPELPRMKRRLKSPINPPMGERSLSFPETRQPEGVTYHDTPPGIRSASVGSVTPTKPVSRSRLQSTASTPKPKAQNTTPKKANQQRQATPVANQQETPQEPQATDEGEKVPEEKKKAYEDFVEALKEWKEGLSDHQKKSALSGVRGLLCMTRPITSKLSFSAWEGGVVNQDLYKVLCQRAAIFGRTNGFGKDDVADVAEELKKIL